MWHATAVPRPNSSEERRLLNMDPNKLLDPALLTYLRREVGG